MFWHLQILKLGIKSLMLHKLRSSLAALGIIFGVCSVIAMLSIGEGASQEAQKQIQLLGTNNIIIKAVKPVDEENAGASRSRLSEYGLTNRVAEIIRDTIPAVDFVVPMRDLKKDVRYGERRKDGRVIGTLPSYEKITQMAVDDGRFLTRPDLVQNANVCVLGSGIARELFGYKAPLGSDVKIADGYYRVVGVLSNRALKAGQQATKDIDFSNDVYIPLTTAKSRFGEIIAKISSGSFSFEKVQLHQIRVRVHSAAEVPVVAKSIKKILKKSNPKEDYTMIVPLELLWQAERTKQIFNIVLGSIAGISLLVGGIGIMNIMLATITERTREIGIRRALGATRRDITLQFLIETVVLSAFGGLLGVALGVAIPFLVTRYAKMETVVTPDSLILAFSISAAAGVIFGLYPAWRAANMDPIEALRHE